MRWEIRGYREGDEPDILSLFALVFGEESRRSESIWRWIYKENPAGTPVIGIARDRTNGTLVSHGAVIPLAGLLRGRPVRFGLAMDAMTHPNYRGAMLGRRGAFLQMARFVIERIVPSIAFAYGFPGERHLRLGGIELGYRPIGAPAHLARELGAGAPPPGRGRLFGPRVRPFRSFGRSADALWRRVRVDYPFSLVRDARYLNWRFRDNPVRKYHFFALTGPLGDWRGWLVLSIEEKAARIVDLLLPRRLPAGAEGLVEEALAFAARSGAATASVFMPAHSPARPLIDRLGFEPIESEGEPILAVRLHDPSVRPEDVAAEFHYQMGDSDMY